MREIQVNRIRVNGEEEYPIYCDLYVLQQIQETMSISQFERDILGAEIDRDENGDAILEDDGRIRLKFGKYNIDTMLHGLALMVNEGIQIEAELRGKDPEQVTEAYLARTWEGSLTDLSNALHREFNRCLIVKKNSPVKQTSRKKRT